jgi:hypothetical protein
MSFPFLYEANLEGGNLAEFSSEVDTESKLSAAHYSWLAQHPARPEIPYSGAYAMYIDLSLGTADAYVQATTGVTLALAATAWYRLLFYAKGLVMADGDRFTILALQSVGDVDEFAITLANVGGTLRILGSETTATAIGAGTRACDFLQDQWHTLEVGLVLDAGGGDDGTATFYVDGYPIGAALTGLNQAALTQLRLGAMNLDAGTTAGHLLFDSLVMDDTRVYPLRRFEGQHLLTKTAHAYVGPGALESLTLIPGAGASDAVLTCYDTDEANTGAPLIVPPLRIDASITESYTVALGSGQFERGCYAVLSGTAPQGWIDARRATTGVPAIRSYAAQRKPHGVS